MTHREEKTRFITPDLLKGIAILFMIQVHLMELFALPDIFASSKLSLFLGGPPAAPIFMIIMGYFIAHSSMSKIAMLKRGVQLIIWGMLLNIGLNMHLIYRVLFESWNYNIWEYIFGVDILQLAGLSLVIIALLADRIKSKWYFIAAIIIAIFVLSSLINGETIPSPWNYFSAYFIGGTSWSYFPLLPWLAYPLTGYAFYKSESFFLTWSWHKYFNLFTIAGFIILMSTSWTYVSNISHHLPLYYKHKFLFYLWIIVFSLLWAGIFMIFSKRIANTKFGKYLIFLGKNITSIYVFQWLIIGNLATIWYQQKGWTELIVYFITITLLSSSLSWAWQEIKHRK